MCTYIDKLHTLLKNTKSYMYIIYVYIINIDQLHTLLHGSMEEYRGSYYTVHVYAVMKLKRLCVRIVQCFWFTFANTTSVERAIP